MRLRTLYLAVLFFLVLPVGCHENPVDPNAAYKSAINSYWRVHPRCLWTQPVKMPAQELAEKSGRTQGYDALTDMGFLQRTQAEKKTFIFGDKPVNVYDLTPQGRAAWIAVVRQPGYGNFCYAHRSVASVDNVTLNPAGPNGTPPATATVPYHYQFPDMAGWARNPELQTAFPEVAAAFSSPMTETATLTKTTAGWVMNTPSIAPPAAPPPDSSAPDNNLGNPRNDFGVVGQTTPPVAATPAVPTAEPAATAANDEADSTPTPSHHHHHRRRH